jgi:hypothetical protein
MAAEQFRAEDSFRANNAVEDATATSFQSEYLILASTKAPGAKPDAGKGGAKETEAEAKVAAEAKMIASKLEGREPDLEEFLSGWEKKLDKHARDEAEKYFKTLKPIEQLAILDYAKATRENPKKPEEGWLGYADRLKKEGVPNVDVAMKTMGRMASSIVFFTTRYSSEQKLNFTK